MEKLIKRVKSSDVDVYTPSHMSYVEKDLTNLIITMRYAGKLFEPLPARKIGERYEIFDGLGRFYASKELGWEEIDVEIFDLTDEQVNEEVVLRNVKSKRSLFEKISHAEMILGILGKSQGKKRDTIGDIDLGDDNYGLAGKDRFEIALAVTGCDDLKPSTFRRLMAVKDFETGDKAVQKLGLMNKMQQEGMKPNQAYKIMKGYLKDKAEMKEKNLIIEGLDYYEGNHHKLFNKTCEDLSDLNDESIDTCVSSPAYLGQKDYEDGKLPQGCVPHGEETTVDQYIAKQVLVFKGLYPKLKNTGSLFLVIAESYDRTNLMVTHKLVLEMVKSGWWFVDEWIWKKNQKPSSLSKRLQPTYEKIFHFVKDPDNYYFRELKYWLPGKNFGVIRDSNDGDKGGKKEIGWSLKRPLERFRNFLDEQRVAKIYETSVFNARELREVDPNFTHPAPFPSFIPLLPILMTSKPGDTVLDIYSGTGTTCAVALQLGRNTVGYDTGTKYHEYAAKRLKMVEENLPDINDVRDFENQYMENVQ